jgi:hypothetical protein
VIERYDYKEAVKQDCEEAIKERIEDDELDVSGYKDFESFRYNLYDKLLEDEDFRFDYNITKAIDYSYGVEYTIDRATAEENVCRNLDLFYKACEELGSDFGMEMISHGAETMDSCIRKYLVREVLQEAINDCEDKLKEYYDKEKAKEEVELD